MRSVLVTRPQPAADELAEKLRREGFEVYLAPLANYVEEAVALEASLAAYQALVFTSAEAVRVFAAKSSERMLTVFAVGEATAKEAAKHGFSKVWQADGSSDDVLRLIRQKKSDLQLKRILHLSGEETTQDLAAALIEEGIAVERKVIYRAEYVDKLPPDIDTALVSGDITSVTLFSPRAAAHLARLLQRKDLRGVSAKIDAVCLSARVADELKVLPWRKVKVAEKPSVEAMIAALKQDNLEEEATHALAAGPVIEAFGGLRPLANRLGLPASTVQGWKQRGVIPEQRTEEIIKAAGEDGIRLENISAKESDSMDDQYKTHSGPVSERRTGADRRRTQATPDREGHIRTSGYSGADRRKGLERRAFEEQQKKRIQQEKKAFLGKVAVSSGVVFILIVLAGALVFLPEYSRMKENARRVGEMEAHMRLMNERLEEMRRESEKQVSLNARISSQVEKLKEMPARAVAAASSAVNSAVGAAADTAVEKMVPSSLPSSPPVEDGEDLKTYLGVLAKAQEIKQTTEGSAAFSGALERLSQILPARPQDPEIVNETVDVLRKQDPMLKALFEGVGKEDVGAAALLLALNEFRGNAGAQRPFESDLALLRKLGASGPEFDQALERLAPYAKSGILSRDRLQNEFKGLAMDIVTAKLQGQDLSTQEEVQKRMQRFVKMRKVADIEGTSVDAVVARTELLLANGDIEGALRELRTLEGPPRETAIPWMEAAEGHLALGDVQSVMNSIISAVTSKASAGLPATLDALLATLPGSDSGAVSIISPSLETTKTPSNPHNIAPFEGR